MTKTLLERGANPSETVQRNARLSQHSRSKRPLPATRPEADALFAPSARMARATASRLVRLHDLGLLELRATPGEPITQGQAHEAILDAIYGPEEPHEQAVEGDGV